MTSVGLLGIVHPKTVICHRSRPQIVAITQLMSVKPLENHEFISVNSPFQQETMKKYEKPLSNAGLDVSADGSPPLRHPPRSTIESLEHPLLIAPNCSLKNFPIHHAQGVLVKHLSPTSPSFGHGLIGYQCISKNNGAPSK